MGEKGKLQVGGEAPGDVGPSLGTFCKYRWGAGRRGSCTGVLQAVYFLAPKSGVAGAFGTTGKREPRSKKLVLKTISPSLGDGSLKNGF